MTNREAYEEAAGMGLEDAFFQFNGIDPNAEYQTAELGKMNLKKSDRIRAIDSGAIRVVEEVDEKTQHVMALCEKSGVVVPMIFQTRGWERIQS